MLTYLLVVVWAALPLARTLIQGGGGDHIAFVHRLYRDAAYILAAVLGIVVFEAALGISLENYWFEDLGQSHRYWLSLEYRVVIFLVVLLSVAQRPSRATSKRRTFASSISRFRSLQYLDLAIEIFTKALFSNLQQHHLSSRHAKYI
jgi:hypothetical protein